MAAIEKREVHSFQGPQIVELAFLSRAAGARQRPQPSQGPNRGKIGHLVRKKIQPVHRFLLDQVRHLADSLLTLDVTPKLSLMANYDYGMDRSGRRSTRQRWQGVAFYGRLSPTSKFKLIPRIEWFDDPQGFTTGDAQTLKEGTLTAEVTMAENTFLRGEYRYDWSNDRVFERNAAGSLSHQSSLTLGVVYTYSKIK